MRLSCSAELSAVFSCFLFCFIQYFFCCCLVWIEIHLSILFSSIFIACGVVKILLLLNLFRKTKRKKKKSFYLNKMKLRIRNRNNKTIKDTKLARFIDKRFLINHYEINHENRIDQHFSNIHLNLNDDDANGHMAALFSLSTTGTPTSNSFLRRKYSATAISNKTSRSLSLSNNNAVNTTVNANKFRKYSLLKYFFYTLHAC